jgi:phosphatidylglycerophosphatase A
MNTLKKLRVTAFGLGLLPLAPGTWASAGAAACYIVVRSTLPPSAAVLALAIGTLLAMFAGFALCPWAQRYFNDNDPRPFVLDEAAGQWFTCLLLWRAWDNGLVSALAAFAAFRFFDVAKPPPINRSQEVKGATGVMVDDMLAAVYAAAVVLVLLRFVPWD